MDDRPIDPFNPYARRYSPQQWPGDPAGEDQHDPGGPAEADSHVAVPAPGLDDTQDIPVVAAVPRSHDVEAAAAEPSAGDGGGAGGVEGPRPTVGAPGLDDTQEVPVVPHQAAGPVSPQPAAMPTAAAQAVPAPVSAPPQWPTGVPETTAVPAPPTMPFGAPAPPAPPQPPPLAPQLTVPPDLVPPRPGGKSPRKPLIAVGAVVAVLLVIAGVVFFAIPPGSGDDPSDRAGSSSDAPQETGEASRSSGEPTKSPSKNPDPESGAASEPGPGDEPDDDDPPPEQKLTVPSRPTAFGAWFAGSGTYRAKWGKPSDDGGADILSYVVGDCNGNNLAFVDSNTFQVTVNAEYLDCMSVYAVNNQGMGADAQHHITNNP